MNNDDRIRRLIGHLAKASKEVKRKELMKHQISHRLKRAKENAPKDVQDELEIIESLLHELLQKDRIVKEPKQSPLVCPPGDDVEVLKQTLVEGIRRESQHAGDYRRMLQDLEFDMALAEKQELERLNIAVDQIGRVNRSISALSDKVDYLHEEEDNRLEQLEKRIRSDVQDNRKQILLIEQEIRGLERKSRQLKEKGQLGKETAAKIDTKITQLKDKADVLKQKYPKSLPSESEKVNLPMEIKKQVFEPRKDIETRKVPELRKPSMLSAKPASGVMELKIPKLAPEAKKVDKVHEFKPQGGTSIEEELFPKLEGFQSDNGLDIPSPKDFPKLEPEEKKFEMPPEFDEPRKLSAWQKFKSWLGFKEEKKENLFL